MSNSKAALYLQTLVRQLRLEKKNQGLQTDELLETLDSLWFYLLPTKRDKINALVKCYVEKRMTLEELDAVANLIESENMTTTQKYYNITVVTDLPPADPLKSIRDVLINSSELIKRESPANVDIREEIWRRDASQAAPENGVPFLNRLLECQIIWSDTFRKFTVNVGKETHVFSEASLMSENQPYSKQENEDAD